MVQFIPLLPLTRELAAKLTEGEKTTTPSKFVLPPPLTSEGSRFKLVAVISTSLKFRIAQSIFLNLI